jgi:hypothetical protein
MQTLMYMRSECNIYGVAVPSGFRLLATPHTVLMILFIDPDKKTINLI